MGDVSGDEAAEAGCIGPWAAATHVMGQEFDAIDVLEEAVVLSGLLLCGKSCLRDLFCRGALFIKVYQHFCSGFVDRCFPVAELVGKGPAEHVDIPIFTKYEGHDDPVIGGAYFPVCPVIAHKLTVGKMTGIWWSPDVGTLPDDRLFSGVDRVLACDATAFRQITV